MSITLNKDQQAAVGSLRQFLMSPTESEIVLSGYAGTGKTTLVKYLLDNMTKFERAAKALGAKLYHCDDIAVTATTRKASTVVANTLGAESLTIYSFLGLVLKNNYSNGETYISRSKNANVKENMLIIVDEASFIDDDLLKNIRDLTNNCKVIYMGDPCQLISVNCDTSPIFDGEIPVVKLTEVMRNEGGIERLSAQFRQSVLTQQFQSFSGNGRDVLEASGPEFQQMIDEAFTSDRYQADKSAKVLAYSNEKVQMYNNYIAQKRGIVEPFPPGEIMLTNKPIINPTKIVYGTDSKVKIKLSRPSVEMKIAGHTVVLSTGQNLFIPNSKKEEKALLKELADKKNWRDYFNIKDYWGDLRPAYASTVHKSQGSTYDKVFIDLTDIGRCHDPDSVARLLYVATSRPSTQVILYGSLPKRYLGETHGEELSPA